MVPDGASKSAGPAIDKVISCNVKVHKQMCGAWHVLGLTEPSQKINLHKQVECLLVDVPA